MSLPVPNLDDKTFEELVEEAKKRIPIYALEEWTDYNVHDPGITFIELFAWLIEMQIYRLDRVTEKNKLKFLKLLGIKPRPATAAKVDVTFSLPNEYPESVLVPKGTKVAPKDTEIGEDIVFETDTDIRVVPKKLKRILSQSWQGVRDNTNANEWGKHFYHAFGEKAEKGSMLYLGFNRAFLDKKIDLMVYLYEADLMPRGKHGEEEPEIILSAEVSWEYSKKGENKGCEWTELEIVRDETLAFSCTGMISFRVPKDMAKCKVPPFEDDELYWIRCKVKKADYEIPPRIDAILLNTVHASQGETAKDEISSTEQPNQSFFLQHRPIFAGSQVISVLNANKLSADVVEGANRLQLISVPELQKEDIKDIIKIEDGTLTNVEYQIISGITVVVQKMRFAHSAATVEINKVRVEELLFTYKLSLDVAEGANSLRLNNIQGLKKDDTLRINDPGRIEYVIIKSVSDTTVTLTSKLLYTHNANTSIEEVKVEKISSPYKLSVDVMEGANSLLMDKVPEGLQKGDILKIEDKNITEYQIISGITIVVQKIRFSHCATTPIKKVRVKEAVNYELSADVAEGANSLRLNNISGLQKYNVLKVDNSKKIEYVIIKSVSDMTVTLTGKLLYGHNAKTSVKKVRIDKIPFSAQDKTWLDWKEVDDFDASCPEDPHYVVDHDTGEIIFGDGIHGLIPPAGEKNIKATYRFGRGERGNVKAGAIDQILDAKFEMLNVEKNRAASGGARKEKLEEAIIRARKDLKEPYRAVTLKDYEYIAKATPGLRVKRAKAISDKKKGSITVVVVPESLDKPKSSDGFRKTVCTHLDKHRLITTGIHVKEPEYVKVSVNAVVKIKGGYEPDNVKQRVEKALKAFLHPLKGGPEGEGWPFGRNVFKSEIYELIDGVEGVDCAQEPKIYDGKKIKIPESGLVYSGEHNIRIIGPEEECRVEGRFS